MGNGLRRRHPLENHSTTTARARKGRNRLTRRSPEAMVHLHPSSGDDPIWYSRFSTASSQAFFLCGAHKRRSTRGHKQLSRLQPVDRLTAIAPFDQMNQN
jgi:hypothetical protein